MHPARAADPSSEESAPCASFEDFAHTACPLTWHGIPLYGAVDVASARLAAAGGCQGVLVSVFDAVRARRHQGSASSTANTPPAPAAGR
jgi:hypothetical protein